MTGPCKLSLANLPTPLFHSPTLDAMLGCETWVKRDDMTGGAETGNKIRKLEYLLGDAQRRRATTVVTSGALQSNHCRATAIAARQVGMRPVLVLRGPASNMHEAGGNLLLDQLVGADIRHMPDATSADSPALLAEVARILVAAGERPYIVPEGGSNGLGALGYVDAMEEIAAEMAPPATSTGHLFDAVVHACGSGGTAAGVVLGSSRFRVAPRVISMAVCDNAEFFEKCVHSIIAEARALRPDLSDSTASHFEVLDHCAGSEFGVTHRPLLTFIVRVARASGLVLDPVYTGKALYALSQLKVKPKRVCFIHTGGLPNTLATPAAFSGLDS